MLGRTDSRARALLVLVAFVLVAGSLGAAPRVLAGRAPRRAVGDGRPAVVDALRDPVDAGLDLRPDGHGRAGHERLARPAGRLPQAARRRGAPRGRRRPPGRRSSASTATPAAELTTRMQSEREYVVLARDLDPAISEQIRTESTGDNPRARRAAARARAGARLPAAGRRPGHDAGRPRARLRQPRRRRASTGSSSSTRTSSRACRASWPRRRTRRATPCPTRRRCSTPGYPGQDLTLTLDASLQVAVEQELLAAWIADRAKRVSAVVMDPYSGEVVAYASYPSYDANDFQAIAATTPERFIDPIVSTVYEPGSVFKMLTATAAIGRGQRDAADPADRHRQAVGRRRPRPRRRRRPPGDGPDGVPRRGRLLAQRRRREGRARARPEHPRVVADPVRHLAPDGLRGADRHRRRQRGAGHRARPGRSRRGARSTSRTAPSARASRSRRSSSRQAYSAMVNGGTLVQPRVVRSDRRRARPTRSTSGRVMSPRACRRRCRS